MPRIPIGHQCCRPGRARAGKGSMTAVSFDTKDLERATLPNQADAQVWYTPDGDGIGLYYFALPPDIDADISNVDDVRLFYRTMTAAANLGMVEAEVVCVAGCQAIRVVTKAPQQPHGMTY